MLSRRESTVSGIIYVLLVLVTTFFIGISCALVLSQAVRTAPNRSWKKNFNATVVGSAYALVLLVSLALCLKRRITVHRKLRKISKAYHTLGKGDLPKPVHRYIKQEYARACLVTYELEPKDGFQEGWGKPDGPHNLRYRSKLLHTIREIDKLAHELIRRHPTLRPHTRMLHHFRFILPLLPRDEDNLTPLHYYDSAIQLARHSSTEPTEEEYLLGINASNEIKDILNGCLAEARAGSRIDLDM